jgi:hypothetical protein
VEKRWLEGECHGFEGYDFFDEHMKDWGVSLLTQFLHP